MMHSLLSLWMSLPLVLARPPIQAHPIQSQASTESGLKGPKQPASQAKAPGEPLLGPLDFHLNPDWSPDPDNYDPISYDGVSPWNDDGVALMDGFLPDMGSWRFCPEDYLNCRRCPRDFRCQPPFASSAASGSAPEPTPEPVPESQPQPPSHPSSEGEFNALTGPQLKGPKFSSPKNTTKTQCALKKCGTQEGLTCGSAATCKQHHCACSPGKKASGNAIRGWTWPDALTVYIDTGIPCDLPCDDYFCSEVPRTKGCVGLEDEVPEVQTVASATAVAPVNTPLPEWAGPNGVSNGDSDAPVMAHGGLGAIQVPGTGEGDGLVGHVAGVADTGRVAGGF